ncbi:MAG: BrnA antitoxin family protein [Actinobacteria bacterium]|nr:BrnA antitoxin family protein [Actinomycetota bacterium]
MSDTAAKKRRRPAQKRIEELADYYDRTDTGDLPWEEADHVIIERPVLEQISIRLPKEDLERIRRRAAKAGVGYTTLIRMILRAHLDDPLTR